MQASIHRILEQAAQGYSVKKVILRNFAKFTGKPLCQGLFFNKFTGLSPATLLKKTRGTCVFL